MDLKKLTVELLSNACHEAEEWARRESQIKYGVGHHCSPNWEVARRIIVAKLEGSKYVPVPHGEAFDHGGR